MMKAAALTAALFVCGTSAAEAQMTWTDKAFVNFSLGLQGGSRTLATSSDLNIYEETVPGGIATTQEVGGGAFFDISGGYKVWRNLAVGIGLSRVGSDADVSVNARVPDPLVTDRLRPASTTASGAKHSELAIHLMGVWMMPVTDKVDVGFSFGPSIFSVSQDVPSAINVTEPGPTISGTTLTSEDKTTMGLNFGVDATYLVTPRIGAGVLVRYIWGSVDIPGASDNLTVGGFQIGGGVRVRF